MSNYQAIEEMRRLTKIGKPFSFEFMSYNRSKQETSGIITVANAKLRSRGKIEHNSNAEIMEEYLDIDTNLPRHFYHATLMFFNGQPVTLI